MPSCFSSLIMFCYDYEKIEIILSHIDLPWGKNQVLKIPSTSTKNVTRGYTWHISEIYRLPFAYLPMRNNQSVERKHDILLYFTHDNTQVV